MKFSVLYFLFLITLNPFLIARIPEKNITIVVPSYNNEQWAKKNLLSLLNQNYTNFDILYIDDCSTDNTPAVVQEIIRTRDHSHKITYRRNDMRKGAMANHWFAAHECSDDTIILHCDGDDWFVHENVLQRINERFEKYWLTFGSYCNYPEGTLGCCKQPSREIINNNLWRNVPYFTSHPRAFYAALFKKIPLEDLIYEGRFLSACCDVGFMLPMLEMAGERVGFIQEVLYAYNMKNNLNDWKLRLPLQLSIEKYIRSRKKFQPLTSLFDKEDPAREKVDCIIFSFNRPLQLYALLESMEEYIKEGLGITTVIYRITTDEFYQAYQQLKKRFAWAKFVIQSLKEPPTDFKEKTCTMLAESPHEYVMFAVDDIIVKDYINLTTCIENLKKTDAYAFFLRLGLHIDYCYCFDSPLKVPELIPLTDDVYAWQFKRGSHDWAYPNTLDMAIYRKKDLVDDFKTLNYTTPNTLEAEWYGARAPLEKIGLCFSQEKIINVPLNRIQNDRLLRSMNYATPEELLKVFQQGLKIDIVGLNTLVNHSVHIEYVPSFTLREIL